MSIKSRTQFATLSLLAACAYGCAASPTEETVPVKTVSAKVQVVGSSSSKPQWGVSEIKGIYTHCAGRSDGESWSATQDPSATGTFPALAVQTNDAACELSVTDVVYEGQNFLASPSLANLQPTFAPRASAFKSDPNAPARFYGNAAVSTHGYESTFALVFVLSATPNEDSSTVIAQPQPPTTQVSQVTSGVVPAPNFAIDTSYFQLETDARYQVMSVGGCMRLYKAGDPGEEFTIYPGAIVDPTAEGLNALWSTSHVRSIDIQSLGGFPSAQILASDFGIIGLNLVQEPVVRTIVIRHYEPTLDLASYELIRVSFLPFAH